MSGSWNYRVMRRDDDFAIFSVYYDADGRCTGWSQTPAPFSADSVEGLSSELRRFAAAVQKPVLDFETGAEVAS
ncbi:MAG: hypothetical protein Q8O67_33240 [Deltaproteobacteria bacterium]|nr:hypothetical protein [Deltaproteobacteria bacterium]